MTCAMLILVWVNDELRYDAFYPKSKQFLLALTIGGQAIRAAAANPVGSLRDEQLVCINIKLGEVC